MLSRSGLNESCRAEVTHAMVACPVHLMVHPSPFDRAYEATKLAFHRSGSLKQGSRLVAYTYVQLLVLGSVIACNDGYLV